jgi:hypothetical protein
MVEAKEACSMMRWRQSTAMLRLTGLVMCVANLLCGQAARRTFTFERDVQTSSVWREIPRWDGAQLVGYEHDDSAGPIVYTIDRDGRRDEFLFTFEGFARIWIHNIAGSPDGEIAIVGSAYTNDNQLTTFLARVASDRKRQLITRTWPYVPRVVTFAPDGTVWTIGGLKKNEDNTRDVSSHFVRHFDRTGRVIWSSTVRVRGPEVGGETASILRASRDRIGWLTQDGEYIEFSLDGAETGRWDLPGHAGFLETTGFALSDENDVIVGHFGKGHAELLELDRDAQAWARVTLPKDYTPSWAWVMGFDGTTLVTHSNTGILRRFNMK